jgi:hypothetical protein
LKYSDYMETCAESLSRAAVAETDYLLSYYIRLQQLTEEVESAFDYNHNLKLPQLDTKRVEILLKSFEQQLHQFELTFPANVWTNREIESSPILIPYTNMQLSLHGTEVLQSPHICQ